jgi:pyrroloquinoline quinone (PQQ) biosynthesis protein C
MSFTADLRAYVLNHGAVNNPYLERFQRAELTEEGLRYFAVQFFAFVKHFPRILATLLANTPDDAAADELCVILTSELGDGNPKKRHEYLYHKFLRSVGVEPQEAATAPWLDSTRDYIEGLAELYGSDDYQVALGASFGLENMAISMWDQLIPGLMKLKQMRAGLSGMNTVYWTFHRALEAQHEDAMMRALEETKKEHEQPIRQGCKSALDLLEGFWMGLEKRQLQQPGLNVNLAAPTPPSPPRAGLTPCPIPHG